MAGDRAEKFLEDVSEQPETDIREPLTVIPGGRSEVSSQVTFEGEVARVHNRVARKIGETADARKAHEEAVRDVELMKARAKIENGPEIPELRTRPLPIPGGEIENPAGNMLSRRPLEKGTGLWTRLMERFAGRRSE